MKKLLLSLALLMAFPASASTIPEGAIVKTVDNPDVYIVKYVGEYKYKRLVLNPLVFKSYGHLKWENLITISSDEMKSFQTSNLVKVDGYSDVYELSPEGDNGKKVKLDSTDFWGIDLNSVYVINSTDFGNYIDNGSKHVMSKAEVQAIEDAQKAKKAKAAEEKKATEEVIKEAAAKAKAEREAAYKLTKEYREEQMSPIIYKINLILLDYSKKIVELDKPIVEKQTAILTHSMCAGMTKDGCTPYLNQYKRELDPLIKERSELKIKYDSLNSIKAYRIQDYIDYGTMIPKEYRDYLNSLGIEVNL